MKSIKCILIYIGFVVCSTQAFASTLWDNHSGALSEAKWQLDGSDQCSSGDDCEDFYDSSSYSSVSAYMYSNTSDQHLRFRTSGNQDTSWRSELRWLDEDGSSSGDGFAKSATKTMTARVGQFSWGRDAVSSNFTISQLHNSDDDTQGPVVRLEYVDSDDSDGGYMRATFREDYDCTSSCTYPKRYWWNQSASGWKNISLKLENYYVTVTVAGNSRTYRLTSAYAPTTEYYWKAGIYLQQPGQANVAFDYITW